MILAVTMAAKCKPAIPADTPKVGAVILVDGEVVAVAHRGEHDHAEKVAIDEARAVGADLTRATIYTTLEPCVAGVRRRTLDSCADRIVSAALKKVVIGIHDPNKDVTGKGFLRLQEAGIETELFPKDLAQKIKVLNEVFIRAQQSTGIKISHPCDAKSLPTERGRIITLSGTWINQPSPLDSVQVIVQRGNLWWPQLSPEPVAHTEDRWTATINIGPVGRHKVIVGKVNPLGKTLIDYFRHVKAINAQRTVELRNAIGDLDFKLPWDPWIGIEVHGGEAPKGIDIEDSVEFTITELVD